jgi:ADP-ribose pyrophosphatase YjhB (NUDIX family)
MAKPEQQSSQDSEKPVWKEQINASASVSVFLNDEQGRLLLVQDIDRHGGKWSPIGGYIDVTTNEEPEMAALREVKEEMGLDVRLDELIGVWHYYAEDDHDAVSHGIRPKRTPTNPDKAHMHIGYAYRGTILGGTYKMQEEEIQNWGFFTPSEVENLYQQGHLKTPQYNYIGFKLWQDGARHPLNIVQSNGRHSTT